MSLWVAGLGWGKAISPVEVNVTQMQTVWAANRRSWEPPYIREVVTWSPSQKYNGLTQLEHCNGWLQALEKRKETKERWWGSSVH